MGIESLRHGPRRLIRVTDNHQFSHVIPSSPRTLKGLYPQTGESCPFDHGQNCFTTMKSMPFDKDNDVLAVGNPKAGRSDTTINNSTFAEQRSCIPIALHHTPRTQRQVSPVWRSQFVRASMPLPRHLALQATPLNIQVADHHQSNVRIMRAHAQIHSLSFRSLANTISVVRVNPPRL